ncbi:hypothetical protein TEA_007218 [Camellia sinensis var. sinensis]|uniref:RING-type E3 ubiquitin transferase n=1 Tax=Camellia sinensis var. sinensis TaxID=542762 RepID=A0A4S4DFY4_CAMSN|nr:hypothetical protein TEA_007218 [Camellia sinensis var. sinensis]
MVGKNNDTITIKVDNGSDTVTFMFESPSKLLLVLSPPAPFFTSEGIGRSVICILVLRRHLGFVSRRERELVRGVSVTSRAWCPLSSSFLILLTLVIWVLSAVVCARIAKIMLIRTVQFLETVYAFVALFRMFCTRGEAHAIPSTIQETASLTSTASLDNSLSDMYRSPPRPLPYDADPRCFRMQRDGLVSRRDKSSSHSLEETEPLRSCTDADSESLNTVDKWNESTCEGSKEYHTRSSLKISSAKTGTEFAHIYFSSEDEDVCPTCLEVVNLYGATVRGNSEKPNSYGDKAVS